MKYLKRFLERIEESDIDDILDILQYVGETTPKIWQDDFVRLSDGILVVYFEDATTPELKEIEDCQSRLMSNGYRLISYDLDETGLWFLVMTKELESKYKDKLLFKFIEDLNFRDFAFYTHHVFSTQDSRPSKYYNLNYPSGDSINIIQNLNKTWFVWDSITDNEEASDNKVLANIDFLKTQHRVLGIQQSLSRGF